LTRLWFLSFQRRG